jgi:hypothetical protein
MKMTTIKIISIDKEKISGIEIGGDDKSESYDKNSIIDIPMNRSIYSGLLAEMKKADVPIDEDLKCFIGRVVTIVEKEWKRTPKELWIDGNPPKTFGVTLRKDLG